MRDAATSITIIITGMRNNWGPTAQTLNACAAIIAADGTRTYTGTVVDPSDAGYLNTNNNSITINHFGGKVYTNLTAQYRFGDRWQLFGGVNNSPPRPGGAGPFGGILPPRA